MKNKASIRSNILKKRKAFSANQVEKSEKKISLIWSRRNEDFKDKKVGFYWPTNNEISPLNILNEMLRRKIECYTSSLDKKKRETKDTKPTHRYNRNIKNSHIS